MATVLVPGMVVRVSAWCVESGQAAVNTFFYFVVTVGGTPATDQDVIDVWGTNVAGTLRALINNLATYQGVQGQIVTPPPLRADVVSLVNAGAGTAGTPALPRQVSGLISWYTALAGRSQRGRTYVPFPAVADDFGDGTPTAAYKTRLDAYSTAVNGVTTISLGGRTATVAQRIFHRATTLSDTIVTKLSRQQWATQRRRGAYGRPNSSPV